MSDGASPLFIVCIEANDTHRMLIELSLKLDPDIRVQLFATGQRMIEKWAESPTPDGVLINFPSPWGGAPFIIEEMKSSIGEDLPPIILLSSTGAHGYPTAGPLAEVAGVIMKPFDPLTFAEQVRALLAMDHTG